jgi:hypothetical protein
MIGIGKLQQVDYYRSSSHHYYSPQNQSYTHTCDNVVCWIIQVAFFTLFGVKFNHVLTHCNILQHFLGEITQEKYVIAIFSATLMMNM